MPKSECTQTSHQSAISNAQDIHTAVVHIYEETAKSIDNLKTENATEELFLLHAANVYANNLNGVVFNLSKVVFKLPRSSSSRHKIEQEINVLCDLATAVHKSFLQDHHAIKTELKNNIKSASDVMERLLAVIALDEHHEYKQEILDCSSDVTVSVDKVRLTNFLKNKSSVELENIIHNEVNQIKDILLSFDFDVPGNRQLITQRTAHGVNLSQICVDQINKEVASGRFSEKMNKLLLEVSKAISTYIHDIHDVLLKDSKTNELVEDIHRAIKEGCAAVSKLLSLLDEQENERVSDDALQVIAAAYANSVSSVIQVRRHLLFAKKI